MDTAVTSNKKVKFPVGAIFYLIYLVAYFALSTSSSINLIIAVITLVPGIMLAVSLLVRKPSAFITVSLALLMLIRLVSGLTSLLNTLQYVMNTSGAPLNILSMLINPCIDILALVFYVSLLILSVASYNAMLRSKATLIKVCKLIAILSLVLSCLLSLTLSVMNIVAWSMYVQIDFDYVMLFSLLPSLVCNILYVVSFIPIAFWLSNPYVNGEPLTAETTAESFDASTDEPAFEPAREEQRAYEAPSSSATTKKTEFKGVCSGYRMDTLIHVVLLLITSGIWKLIWIYRTTELLNYAEGETKRDPLVCLLLSIFVPFYQIYWVYVTSQRIDKMAKAYGIPSDICTLCLILAFFVPVVPPILMQDKLNNIIDAATAA